MNSVQCFSFKDIAVYLWKKYCIWKKFVACLLFVCVCVENHIYLRSVHKSLTKFRIFFRKQMLFQVKCYWVEILHFQEIYLVFDQYLPVFLSKAFYHASFALQLIVILFQLQNDHLLLSSGDIWDIIGNDFKFPVRKKKVVFMPATEKHVSDRSMQVRCNIVVMSFLNFPWREVFWRVKCFVSFSVVTSFNSELSWLNRTVPIVLIGIIFLVCPASHMSLFAPVT